MSVRQLGLSNGISTRQKRFSIDDAFEEETDEAIKVYGATTTRSPVSPNSITNGDCASIRIDSSRDSDSLIQDYYDGASQENLHRSCFRHPKVRENWRMVLAATTLLFIGIGLLATGTMALAEPEAGLQGAVFLLAGFICFVPGAYHVVYIYLAAKGKRGYHFHNLPLFT
ncbi:Transmembrane protein [Popillia japonica]|uniref:Transmembrane protein n=1 Tax=Popillia japonica TaxID=7064 RepID=A0AAW1N135_POPJA